MKSAIIIAIAFVFLLTPIFVTAQFMTDRSALDPQPKYPTMNEEPYIQKKIPESVIGTIDISSHFVVLDRELNKAYFTLRVSHPIYSVSLENDSFTIKEIATGVSSLAVQDMEINEETHRLYVADDRVHQIIVIDTVTDEMIDTFPVDRQSNDIEVNESKNQLVVLSTEKKKLLVFDTSNDKNSLINTIPFDVKYVQNAVLSENTNTVYVISSSSLIAVDLNNNEITELTRSNLNNREIEINKKTGIVYVLTANESRTINRINVWDIENNEKISEIDVDKTPTSLGINTKTNMIYVIHESENTISIIDGSKNSVIREFEFPPEMMMRNIAINENTDRAYIAGGNDFILVVDLDCSCPLFLENLGNELKQKKFEEDTRKYQDFQIEEIMGTYRIYSMDQTQLTNEDAKMWIDVTYDIFEKYRDSFSEQDVFYLKNIEPSDPDWSSLDPVLDRIGIKGEFYQGMTTILKEIFQKKIPLMDSFRDETIQKIKDLDIEEAEQKNLISEINKITEENKKEFARVAATFIRPFEQKAVTAEKEDDLASEILGDLPSGGGCLIATATYGSELAPPVQQLREIRDNSLLQTESGRSFMESFNQFYYSFSPSIADLERENLVFKEAVKLAITPLITSLSILNYVDMDSESEVLGYGIGIILMNIGMYFVLPAIIIHRVRKFV